MTATNTRRAPFMRCPHCGSPATVRNSLELTPTLREASYQCPNLACGCAFVAQVEVVRELVPSVAPNPAIAVPLSQHAVAARQRAAGAPAGG